MTPLRGPLRKKNSHLWDRHPEDWYVEPSWCSERLFAVERFEGRVWDPSAGLGRIPTAAQAAGLEAVATDLVDRGCADHVKDFLTIWQPLAPNIVSNPPFGIAERYVSHALQLATGKVAMLLPANWVQGDVRSRWLEGTPLRRVYFIAPRPSMPPGPAILAGERPGNGTTDYAWFVWLRGYDGRPELQWLRRDPARAGLSLTGVPQPRPAVAGASSQALGGCPTPAAPTQIAPVPTASVMPPVEADR